MSAVIPPLSPLPQRQDAAVPRVRPAELALLVSVFVVAACGLVYELVAGALASYLLGDSVLQFSTVIGTYLFAMGIGAWLSRFFERQLVAQFVRVQLLVAVAGGFMPAVLFVVHGSLPAGSVLPFRISLYGLVLVVGILVGLEIPLVMRILKRHFSERYALKDLLSQVLTFDYLGALAVSIAFPLLLVPHLGLTRTAVMFGLLNALVALWSLILFRAELRAWRTHVLACAIVLASLIGAWFGADALSRWAEDRFYGEHIVFARQSPYQRVVVTASAGGVRLFLNGNLQFHSRDEYRYHEALVHPAMLAHGAPKKVLVLGGGDGMAVREILKYPTVERVTLVELDPAMTELFSGDAMLAALNGHSLRSPKLSIVNQDAFGWLQQLPADTAFDVIVIDFPDPSSFAIGKLYSTTFYELVDRHLSAAGFAVVQSTSPLVARKSFWTVASTLEAAGLATAAYHAHVPSFGEWGYVIASHRPLGLAALQARPNWPPGLRFLTPQGLPALFDFPPDMARVEAEPNRLSTQSLVHTFEAEWGKVHD